MEGFVLKNRFFSSYCTLFIHHPEVGIYERKQENAFDKESNKEKKKKKKTRSLPRQRSRKNDNGQEKKRRKHAPSYKSVHPSAKHM